MVCLLRFLDLRSPLVMCSSAIEWKRRDSLSPANDKLLVCFRLGGALGGRLWVR